MRKNKLLPMRDGKEAMGRYKRSSFLPITRRMGTVGRRGVKRRIKYSSHNKVNRSYGKKNRLWQGRIIYPQPGKAALWEENQVVAGKNYLPIAGQTDGMGRKVPERMENLPDGVVKSTGGSCKIHRKVPRHTNTSQAQVTERTYGIYEQGTFICTDFGEGESHSQGAGQLYQ